MRRFLLSLFLSLSVCGAFAQLNGKFSVSATKQVQFSKGNLVYIGASKTFSFAANQYSQIGSGNQNISPTYTGTIDLFGWGTSGYNNCMPYETSLSVVYGGGGSTIAGTQYDWGVKNFTNYRTLTNDEWSYLLSSRPNATSLRGPATVNGVKGWILLPDNWATPSGITFKSLAAGASAYTSNTYSSSQFSTLQSAGAVFLPAAGWRYSSGSATVVSYVGSMGYYWTATSGKAVTFGGNYCYAGETAANYSGCAVRLVYDTSSGGGTTTQYTITTAVSPAGAGTITGAGTYERNSRATFKATATGEYEFYRFEFDADNTYSSSNPWSFYVTKSGKVTAVFQKKTYPVWASSRDEALGTVTPGYCKEPKGTKVTFTAEAKPGCRFVKWEDGVTTPTRTYTIKGTETASDGVMFWAVFEAVNTYTLTVSSAQPEWGTVTADHTTCAAGTKVNITATPAYGYKFVCWNSEAKNTSNPKSFYIYGDSTYVGSFDVAKKVLIEVQPDDEGFCTVSGGGEYYEQEAVAIRAYPQSGKKFSSWRYYKPSTDTWEYATSNNPYAFRASVNRKFKPLLIDAEPVTVNVTSADEEQGTVTVTPQKDVYYQGDTIYLQAHPVEPCFRFSLWTGHGSENPLRIILTSSIDTQATFKAQQSTIAVQATKSGKVRILENSEEWTSTAYYTTCPETPVTIEAQDFDDYFFDHWSDGNTDNPRTYIMPYGNDVTVVRAYYNKKTFGGYCGYNPAGNNPSFYPPTEDAWWTYDEYNTIRIEGEGSLYEFGWYQDEKNYIVSKAPWYDMLKSEDTKYSLIVEEGITNIPPDAFLYCKGLEQADLCRSAVQTIKSRAFRQCTNLTKVTLPESLETIDDEAFMYAGLETLVLPRQVNWIGSKAFMYCTKLGRIILTNPTPATVDRNNTVFNDYIWYGAATDVIYVPSGTRQAYLNTNNYAFPVTWDEFIHYIIEWHQLDMDIVGEGTCRADTTTFIAAGDMVQLTPVAAEGWLLKGITLVDEQGNEQVVEEPYKFEMPESNVTVRVEFEELLPTMIQEVEKPLPSAGVAKFVKDGRIYIRRGGKIYDTNGRLIIFPPHFVNHYDAY